MTTVSEAGPIREPVEYPEHDDSGNEDILVSEGTITDYMAIISSSINRFLNKPRRIKPCTIHRL